MHSTERSSSIALHYMTTTGPQDGSFSITVTLILIVILLSNPTCSSRTFDQSHSTVIFVCTVALVAILQT